MPTGLRRNMKRIDGTELEYEDDDEVVLDFYLGGEGETKVEWAKRVWDSCEKHAKGEITIPVFACRKNQTWKERAHELWENKKLVRKKAFVKFLKLKDDKKESLLEGKNHKMYITRDEFDKKQR